MSQELKPCPFCGAEGQLVTVKGYSAASCSDYMCPGHQMALMHKTEESAIAAWNKRAQPAGEAGQDEREAFEQRCYYADGAIPGCIALERDKADDYRDLDTNAAWEVWQMACEWQREQFAAPPAAANQAGTPEGFIRICQEELARRKLTSVPLKFAFAKERGMSGLDEVHAWMITTAKAFEKAVQDLGFVDTHPESHPKDTQ